MLRTLLVTAALFGTAAASASERPLHLQVYNPGEAAIFPVSSELISGEHDAVLIDAQFARSDAQNLVQLVKASGKRLTTIYISHGDPDFYFGLDVLKAAFPDAKILATPQTIAHIEQTQRLKLDYWGPILKANAPQQLIVPQPLQGDSLSLEGQQLKVVGLDGPTPERTVVWIPALKAVVGGVAVESNLHVWTADTQSQASRQAWLASLDQIEALKPEVLVPGHYLGKGPQTLAALQFTRTYLKTLEAELPKAKDSAALVAAMKRHYPSLAGEADLELSAKVLKGEMQWP
ncbi:MBL fold metallo-hydrolase [Pseudomonas sp. 2FG]|uniref:MBL fold metallo-hydrolase n=1 Tax=Pseudomonas sp. 2FG TaxID=2502191 RepID=UPI001C49A473